MPDVLRRDIMQNQSSPQTIPTQRHSTLGSTGCKLHENAWTHSAERSMGCSSGAAFRQDKTHEGVDRMSQKELDRITDKVMAYDPAFPKRYQTIPFPLDEPAE